VLIPSAGVIHGLVLNQIVRTYRNICKKQLCEKKEKKKKRAQ
jgi:hypothetical protein